MIAIVNVSDENTPSVGVNEYELRINSNVLCKFKHDRAMGNLSQCLRDAADAWDKVSKDNLAKKAEDILKIINEEVIYVN